MVLQFSSMALIATTLGGNAVASGNLSLANMPLGIVVLSSIALISFLMLSTTARRFQDCGWSGRWFLWMFYLLIPAIALGIVTIIGTITNNAALAVFGFVAGFLALFPIYASIIWTFWIGFVRTEAGPNLYGPHPNEVTP
jgi:uncharacterized membrane protein YhaH (DUF805 family)